ncbi:MAG: hypothetical protein A3K19_24855 [Lentisphaerae bacterium RIFOXYB12_FULL_65_16]|nr:MAG: hypothetical protein A3K18_19080 [Lentisphaerae bacterium RIFOXYA12_64_32]OGV90702.1 MAG: hypothetical protein A3K19_24855 [Lentisphaerae bacterium RIFOXYB12_FULL_65_16]
MTAQGEAELAPGSLVAGYRIERELGRGNMAVVYLATQMNLLREVALKVLARTLADDEEYVCRFFNEARAAAALSHPNIIQIYDAGVSENDTYFLSMEYVQGENLDQLLARDGYLEPTRALNIGLDVAQALHYGWQSKSLIHGDIKPENIMINVNGTTRLADFGLAKIVGHEFAGQGAMLTPLYGAPEIIRGQQKAGDCRADIYSFGASLYHMLCGVPPFPGTDPQEVMDRHVSEPPLPLRDRNPAVSREISDYVLRLLEKAPDARPQGWAEVVERLKGFLGAGTAKKKPVRKFHLSQDAATALATPPDLVAGTGPAPRKRVGVGSLALAVLLSLSAAGLLGVVALRLLRPAPSDVEDAAVEATATPAPQPAAPEPAVSTTAPSPKERAQAEWLELRERLKHIDDIQAQFRLLEAFQAKHGDENTPAAVTARLRGLRKSAGPRVDGAAAPASPAAKGPDATPASDPTTAKTTTGTAAGTRPADARPKPAGKPDPNIIESEDAEDGDTASWDSYDERGVATITNVEDPVDANSRVINLDTGGTTGGARYTFVNPVPPGAIIQWRMCRPAGYVVYLLCDTTLGTRYLQYTPGPPGKTSDDQQYVPIQLPPETNSGAWVTVRRDPQTDLKDAQPDNELIGVKTFLTRGNGYIDDLVVLRPQGAATTVTPKAEPARRPGVATSRLPPSKATSTAGKLADGAVAVASSLLSEDASEARGLDLLRFALAVDPGNAWALLLQAKLERNQPLPQAEGGDQSEAYVDYLQSVIRKTSSASRQLLLWEVIELVDPKNEAALLALTKAKNKGVDTRFEALLAALGGATAGQ